MTTRKTLHADRAETFKLSVRYVNEAGPIDLSQHIGSMFVKDLDPRAQDLGQYYGEVETAEDGWVHIVVPTADTNKWPVKSSYVIAIELDNDVTHLMTGTLEVRDY